MADTSGAPGVGGLPPMPQAGPAPGQQDYAQSANTGPAGSSHMPPPSLPPVQIPPNNNPIPTELQTPGGSGGSVRRAAPEPNKRALYVGGLDPRVGEDLLRQIFETAGHVQNVKIIPDKNAAPLVTIRTGSQATRHKVVRAVTEQFLCAYAENKGYNYGFVEFDDPGAANRAMDNLNGRHVHDHEIKVNWAYQNNNMAREDTSNHYHIFVGDLSNDVNDEVLLQAFSVFGVVSEARVMWDMKTGRSRGYGFVAFRDQSDAGRAISSMDGEWLGSRAIRCNWANQKGQPSISQQNTLSALGLAPPTPFQAHHQFPTNGVQSYDTVANQTPQWQTTVYVGNLTPYTTQNDVVPLFNNFGSVLESRFQADRGFAFIKMDLHENAAMAICQLQGYQVNGRPLKCSWGKDRPPTGNFTGFNPADPYAAASPVAGSPAPFAYPQYAASPMSPQGGGPNPYGLQSPTGFAPDGMQMAAQFSPIAGPGRGHQYSQSASFATGQLGQSYGVGPGAAAGPGAGRGQGGFGGY